MPAFMVRPAFGKPSMIGTGCGEPLMATRGCDIHSMVRLGSDKPSMLRAGSVLARRFHPPPPKIAKSGSSLFAVVPARFITCLSVGHSVGHSVGLCPLVSYILTGRTLMDVRGTTPPPCSPFRPPWEASPLLTPLHFTSDSHRRGNQPPPPADPLWEARGAPDPVFYE